MGVTSIFECLAASASRLHDVLCSLHSGMTIYIC